MEYSRNIKKKVKQLKYAKFWNMEYSMEYSKKIAKQPKYWKFWNMEYSWNIPKKVQGGNF